MYAEGSNQWASRSLLNLASGCFDERERTGHLDADYTFDCTWHVWHRG